MKEFLFFLFLLAAMGAKAENAPMLTEGFRWLHYEDWSFEDEDIHLYSWYGGCAVHEVCEEVQVGGKSYHVLTYTALQYGARQREEEAPRRESQTPSLRIREEDDKVYVIYQEYMDFMRTSGYRADLSYMPYEVTDDGEMVLYDFTMQVGDKFRSVAGYEDISVVQVGTVTDAKGKSRRQLTLSNGCKVVEGVGCITPGRMLLNYLNPGKDSSSNNGRQLYTALLGYGERGESAYFSDMSFYMSRDEIRMSAAELTGESLPEYEDPESHVVYVYDTETGTARVKRGSMGALAVVNPGHGPQTGSPEATGALTVQDKIVAGGREYTVTSIGAYAFYGCKGITSVVIPESIESIEDEAFSACGLTGLTSLSREPQQVWKSLWYDDYYASDGLFEQATLYVPKGSKEKYEAVEPWNMFSHIEEMEINRIDSLPAEVFLLPTPLFDLQGRRVTTDRLKPGIYVRQGRKFVVK